MYRKLNHVKIIIFSFFFYFFIKRKPCFIWHTNMQLNNFVHQIYLFTIRNLVFEMAIYYACF